MSDGTISGLITVGMALTFFSIMLYVTVGKDYKQNKLAEKIQIEALKGNKNAILMAKRISLVRHENKKVILEALKGNENAIEILGLNNKSLY